MNTLKNNSTKITDLTLADNVFRFYDINYKHKTLLYSQNGLLKFYKNPVNKKIFMSIIRQETPISLRLLDWLVTNYSKKHNIHYEVNPLNPNTSFNLDKDTYVISSNHFNMWIDYKNQLKSYSKRLFDPFQRRQRILLNFETHNVRVLDDDEQPEEDNNIVITTVGQLNFFRWAINNKVIDYAFEYNEDIESDMLSSADKRSTNKTGRRQLSKNNSCAKSQKAKLIVQFN